MCYWASTAEVITCAESGGLSFHLGLEMFLKGPTYPPCYSCGEEFKKQTHSCEFKLKAWIVVGRGIR